MTAASERRCATRAGRLSAVLCALITLFCDSSSAQDADDAPLLPSMISEQDIEMSGRYARQWRESDGGWVVAFTGGFRLDMGKRRLSAVEAVVWIQPRRSDEENRKFYDLTVYLSESAEVQEPAGTSTQDSTLLVTNLRTFGRVAKSHDAHAPESLEGSPLYVRATQDRALVEARASEPAAEAEQAPVEVARPAEAGPVAEKRPAPVIRYDLPPIEPAETSDGQPCFVAIGRVWFSRSGGQDSATLEIQADNAVVFPAEGAAQSFLGDIQGPDEAPSEPASESKPATAGRRLVGPQDEEPESEAGLGSRIRRRIKAVYLEGDVVLSHGDRVIRAHRLFYDFERDRALLLDAVFRMDVPQRGIPLYVRADEIRQLSAREFSARNAKITTSEFYTPHYHIGADSIYLYDRTPRDAGGAPAGTIAGTYEVVNSTLNVQNTPVLYWPRSKGNLEESETLLRRLRTGYSDDFGYEFESAWHLFNLLGVEAPPGVNANLKLDYFSERGPATGIDVDYKREDQFGLFKSYYVNDKGEDDFGPFRDNTPESDNRGRITWRHRHYLPNDWELTLETSYISDPGYLEEYEKSEFYEDKEQETVVYLKRARDNEAVTLLANWRLLDFYTQTEHLPELAYRRIGDTFMSPLITYHESRVGGVRYRPDDRNFFDTRRFRNDGLTDLTLRADGREEFEWPIQLPGFNAVPFASFRGSYWDGQPLDEGGLWRGFAVYGVRGGAYLSRVYEDLQSELLDINRIRHIIRPEYTAWWAHSNADSELITPFDEGIETIDDFYGFRAAIKQAWQTKRGVGDNVRTVDLLTLDLEAGAFGGNVQGEERSNGYVNPIRPEDSRTRNYVSADLAWRLSDTTSFLYDLNFDLNDGSVDRHDVAVAIERSPRLAYVWGYRYAGDIDLNLFGGGFNYRLNEKHATAFRMWFDVETGNLGEVAVSYVRKLPRWNFAINVESDQVFDDFSVSVSLWPEGIPEWTLGSRRFTNLATSTAIRP